MPKVSQQHRDARRDQILSAARRCFLRDGFHATSMQDLFAEAGLSSGAVYGYFAGKDDVIIAIAEENMADIVAMSHEIAVRRPGSSAGAMLTQLRTDLAQVIGDQQQSGELPRDVPADTLAGALLAVVPGFIVQLTMLGPAAVDGMPDALRALWP